MKIRPCLQILILGVGIMLIANACAPVGDQFIEPPKPTQVNTIDIEMRSFGGRPDATAVVEGLLSNAGAQLVDSKQYRKGYRLYIEVMEQTPRNAVSAQTLIPFKQKIPIETIGLTPGVYILNVNGVEKRLEIPASSGQSNRGEML